MSLDSELQTPTFVMLVLGVHSSALSHWSTHYHYAFIVEELSVCAALYKSYSHKENFNSHRGIFGASYKLGGTPAYLSFYLFSQVTQK